MNLSHFLFTTIYNKLKLNVFLFNKETFSIKIYKTGIDFLKNIKKNNYKILGLIESRFNSKNSQNVIVVYIINISFLKTNTMINISDIKGNVKLFYSAGLVDLVGKQKKKRRIAISKLVLLLLIKATFLYKNPVALHLNNVSSYKKFIVTKLKKILYLRVIKIFNQPFYNGCRKKKLPRKKFIKKFK